MVWTNSGGDHEGEDWVINSSGTYSGTHTNVGAFILNSGPMYIDNDITIYCARAEMHSWILNDVFTSCGVLLVAQQKIYITGGIRTAKPGADGADVLGSQGLIGSTGTDGVNGSAGNDSEPPTSCQGGDGTNATNNAGTGGVGQNAPGTAGDGTNGGQAGWIDVRAPRVTWSGGTIDSSGGDGGRGGNSKGGKGGHGGYGGDGGDGGDAYCSGGCSPGPHSGGDGGDASDGGIGGVGGNGGYAGNGGHGGSGHWTTIKHAAPASIYIVEGNKYYGFGYGGTKGLSQGGDPGDPGIAGTPGSGGAPCGGGSTGASGGTGSPGSAGSAGLPTYDGIDGTDDANPGSYSLQDDFIIDGRKIYQQNGYYGKRMRCDLITNDAFG